MNGRDDNAHGSSRATMSVVTAEDGSVYGLFELTCACGHRAQSFFSADGLQTLSDQFGQAAEAVRAREAGGGTA